MNHQIADDFIAELESTIQNFEEKRDAAPNLGTLLDVSSHMIEALGLLKANLHKASTDPATP